MTASQYMSGERLLEMEHKLVFRPADSIMRVHFREAVQAIKAERARLDRVEPLPDKWRTQRYLAGQEPEMVAREYFANALQSAIRPQEPPKE